MLEKTIQAVKEAEQEASKVVQNAWDESDEIQKAASKEAEELKEAIRLASVAAAKDRAQRAKDDGEQALQKSAEESQSEAKAIRDTAVLKEDLAVKAIIAELLK